MLCCRNLKFSICSQNIIQYLCRNTSKIAVELNPQLVKKFEGDELKFRHHPGRCKTNLNAVPSHITTALQKSLRDYPEKTLIAEGKKLNQYLKARHPPPENIDIKTKLKDIKAEIKLATPLPDFSTMTEADIQKFKMKQKQKIDKTLKERVYSWKPLSYGPFESLVYAISRSPLEYTILMKIFLEIIRQHPTFTPRSYFDFGSGVGTGMWAASSLWKDTIFEYFNVDCSKDMNDLSELILRDGNENQHMTLKNVFYRQFLPSTDTKYDLVVSSFSLFELPNARTRKEVLENLWSKCDGYLVIVEEGTRAGFELVAEARDYVLNSNDSSKVGHVFSPCPSDHACPRLADAVDRTPCNFEIKYENLPIGQLRDVQRSRYSYVVIKRGPRDSDNESNNWPRIVRPTLKRKKHTICRTCTADGKLQEIIFTAAKHGRFAYRCARSSEWGDRLPLNIVPREEKEEVSDAEKADNLNKTEE